MGRQSDARDRLVRSAGELWHQRSYADVGVSEICEHAEVQKGSFYHFFSSKRELALAVIDEAWHQRGVCEMAPLLTGSLPPLPDPSWFERLTRTTDVAARGLPYMLGVRRSRRAASAG